MVANVMWIPRQMHRSPAFGKLSRSSIMVYLEIKYRCQYQRVGRKGKYHHINDGEIILTYNDAEKKLRLSRSTIARSLSQLVKLGFIEITHQGGGMLKDHSKYGLSDRWENFGKEYYIQKSRKKDTRGLGFTKEKWEEQTGRKRKIQSKISNVNDTNSSIADDTSKTKNLQTPSIILNTHQIDVNYYISKGLTVLRCFALFSITDDTIL